MDAKVFNPYVPSNSNSSTMFCYKKHENLHATYFSATGGMAPEAPVFYKRLASPLASKWNDHYSITMGWLRCSLLYSLL